MPQQGLCWHMDCRTASKIKVSFPLQGVAESVRTTLDRQFFPPPQWPACEVGVLFLLLTV